MDELSCVPETQQAAGVEELVVGVEDPLGMSDTEQGDIGVETQHKLDTSDEDTQDTQAAKYAATVTLAADAAAAGNSTTAFHTVTAASTAAATDNTNTSANTAAAAAHMATHSANITAANITKHHFIITVACHVTTHYNTRN